MTKLCPLSLQVCASLPKKLDRKMRCRERCPFLLAHSVRQGLQLNCYVSPSERSLHVETLRTFHTNARSCNGRFYYHCYDEKLQKFGATRWQHAVFDLFLAVQAKIQHKITKMEKGRNCGWQVFWLPSVH